MAANINRIFLAGNLTRDPQVRFFANEKAVADFGIAINRRYRGSDGQQKEETTYVDIEAWGRTAELVGQYLVKGRSCLVEGRLKLDQWDDKNTGQKRSKLKVLADSVQFLDGNRGSDSKNQGQSNSSDQQARKPNSSEQGQPQGPVYDDDEPPF